MRRFPLLVLVVLAGCKDDSAASAPAPEPAPRPLAGVYPEQWQCEQIATLDALGGLLGGNVKQIDSAMPVPTGVPRPCTYQIQSRDAELWTFDLDCRDSMKQTADALFTQYRESSHDAVVRHARADAGARAQDAGADFAPSDAMEVEVGAKGLDHHGRGLIFIDDDAPCYVRVTGRDAARRRELAKHLAKTLTFANAPMKPRAFR
jgi:hypothetical protein